MRTLTIVFVGLVALPACILGWLGFQYADTLESRARERIERDLDAGLARQEEAARADLAASLRAVEAAVDRLARSIALDLPFRLPAGRWLVRETLHAPAARIELLAEGVDDRGSPLGPRELTELPEWPVFLEARDSGAEAVFVSPRLQRRLEELRRPAPEDPALMPGAWTFEERLPYGGRLLVHTRWKGESNKGVAEGGLRFARMLDLPRRGGLRNRLPFGVRRKTVQPVAGIPYAMQIILQHPEAEELVRATSRRRWLTGGAIGALLALMAVGLWLARRALLRERDARQLRDAFIANVSHELKTPLTSVRMYAEMLADDEVEPAKREEYGRVVDVEGARLAALVDDMLDFSALERGAREVEVEPTDVARLAHATVEAWRPLAEREGVALEVDGPREGVVVLADPSAVGRIVTNLLQNALKHGAPPRDGETQRICVYIDGGLAVCDNGPGIPAAEREVVFDRFRRGAGAGNKAGAGIGLALSRELARAMNGELIVEDDGTWTRFVLRLPPVSDEPACNEF